MGVPHRLSELIGDDSLPAAGSVQADFATAATRGSIAAKRPQDFSRIDFAAFKL